MKKCVLFRRLGLGDSLTIVVVTVLLILAAAPVIQIFLASMVLKPDALNAYLTSSQHPAFYQFVLTGITVLVAVAGYLTYRSRQDIVEETKKEKEDWLKQKESIEQDLNKMRGYGNVLKEALEKQINHMLEEVVAKAKIDVVRQAEAVCLEMKAKSEGVSRLAEAKISEISKIQMPLPGESEQMRLAREAANNGFTLFHKGDLEGAIAAYRDAIKIQPNMYGVYCNLGLALNAKNDFDGAIAAYREAIRQKPDMSEAFNNLGNTLGIKGDLDGAIAAYREAIRNKQDMHEAHFNLGCTLRTKGDLDGAIGAFRDAIRFKPNMHEAYLNLGVTLKDKGDIDGAITAYREAIRIIPNKYVAHFNLGLTLETKGDFEGAIDAYRKAIHHKPDMHDAHFNLAITLTTKGDIEGAIAAYRDAIKLHINDQRIYNGLAWLLSTLPDEFSRLRDGKTAIELAAKAIMLEGEGRNRSVCYDTLAAAYAEAGRFDEAMKSEEEAIRLVSGEGKEERAEYEARLKLYQEKKPFREEIGEKKK